MSAIEDAKARSDAAEKRTAKVIYDEIVARLSIIDGISTGDAMELGRLIHEHGEKRASETSSGILFPLLDVMLATKDKKAEPPKEPWQK